MSLKFHLCIKLAAIFHFPFLLTFLLPVLFLLLLVKFLFNFRLACEWARDFGYVYVVYVAYARYICIHLRWLSVEIAHTPRFVFDFADTVAPADRINLPCIFA